MRFSFLYVVCIIVTLNFLACGGIKPTSNGAASNLYETFYTGKTSGTQYFIKPLAFAGENGTALYLDITFRDGQFKTDSATINYTLITNKRLAEEQSLTAVAADGQTLFTTQYPTRLFLETDKEMFRTRFSGKVDNVRMLAGFDDPNVNFTLSADDQSLKLMPTSKTSKALKAIRERLLVLYRPSNSTNKR